MLQLSVCQKIRNCEAYVLSKMDKDSQEQDCAICLQKYHHPTRLPCGHIFCFLCVKGIAIQSKKCAMCRMEIPHDYFDHPDLIEKLGLEEIASEGDTEKYQWYYEGRNGWWKYDERSNMDLENMYSSGETECLLLLAGTIYCVDFHNMIQIRRSDPTKRRRVKRDIPTLPSKGIAGIKKVELSHTEVLDSNHENSESNENEEGIQVGSPNLVPGNYSTNTPTSPISVDDLIDNLRQIDLHPDDPLSTEQDVTQNSADT
ncbi:E3 ubiquitin-protein ligase RNF146-B [Nymphalis io]|uniref:E3 ubiquitin-protein ligase RNF146-B n=1 Tax=Inachis io TaxID=171585 RepID=UPI002166D7AC|nr:E3 ubiquitin-protein ligase RNF146-B [Nymphalis io]